MQKLKTGVMKFRGIGAGCLLFLAACSANGQDPQAAEVPSETVAANESTSSTTTTAPASTTTTVVTTTPETTTTTELATSSNVAFNGRIVPQAPSGAEEAAAMFVAVHDGLRAEGSTQDDWADLGHTEQLIIRTLVREPEWEDTFLAGLPDDYATIAELHLTARRELGLLHAGGPDPSERIPAWRVIDPEPLDVLIEHYQRAGDATGIDWQILAGVNLVETGMGRIDGVSSAGAQGPMQFLPTTWEEVSEGGDIHNPADAIPGAARYLVQRGGLEDISAGLWGYNNSDHYGNAVLAYAEMVTFDERARRGFYNWEIYVGSAEGTLWRPVGYEELEPRAAADYVDENPWANTLK